jgi:acetylornithine deacetylase
MLDKILNAIDPQRLTQLLIDSVNRYSPSYAEEPATKVFEAALQRAGIPCARQPVLLSDTPEARTNERANLIVRLGPDPLELLWVGHVDTVALVEDDRPRARLKDGKLYGLGSADMKSGCAAAVEALTALVASGVKLKRGLALALVVGEEQYGDGAEALSRSLSAPLTIVGEPTGLQPCIDHYGYLECKLISRGSRAHAALPEVGDNAIHAMLAWIMHIFEEAKLHPRAGSLVFNPREITGGAPIFAVPERCDAALDVHLLPDTTRDDALGIIEAARARALLNHGGCDLSSEQIFWAPGYASARADGRLDVLQRAWRVLERPFEPVAFRSHSDASLLYQRGTLPVVCGPGMLEVAHTPHEHVHLDQLQEAARLYAAMMYEACVA